MYNYTYLSLSLSLTLSLSLSIYIYIYIHMYSCMYIVEQRTSFCLSNAPKGNGIGAKGS